MKNISSLFYNLRWCLFFSSIHEILLLLLLLLSLVRFFSFFISKFCINLVQSNNVIDTWHNLLDFWVSHELNWSATTEEKIQQHATSTWHQQQQQQKQSHKEFFCQPMSLFLCRQFYLITSYLFNKWHFSHDCFFSLLLLLPSIYITHIVQNHFFTCTDTLHTMTN